MPYEKLMQNFKLYSVTDIKRLTEILGQLVRTYRDGYHNLCKFMI